MKINTHGIKMVGLKAAAGETKYNMGTAYHGAHVQIDYDLTTGDVLAQWIGSGDNWIEYHNHEIIGVAKVSHRCTKQEIADMVTDAVELHRRAMEKA